MSPKHPLVTVASKLSRWYVQKNCYAIQTLNAVLCLKISQVGFEVDILFLCLWLFVSFIEGGLIEFKE